MSTSSDFARHAHYTNARTDQMSRASCNCYVRDNWGILLRSVIHVSRETGMPLFCPVHYPNDYATYTAKHRAFWNVAYGRMARRQSRYPGDDQTGALSRP